MSFVFSSHDTCSIHGYSKFEFIKVSESLRFEFHYDVINDILSDSDIFRIEIM